MTLNKDIIELDYDSTYSIDKEQIIDGIIIPSCVNDNGMTKTVICKIRDINKKTAEEYNLHPGDTILVDRYAIIQTKKGLDFTAFIRINSVVMKEVA